MRNTLQICFKDKDFENSYNDSYGCALARATNRTLLSIGGVRKWVRVGALSEDGEVRITVYYPWEGYTVYTIESKSVREALSRHLKEAHCYPIRPERSHSQIEEHQKELIELGNFTIKEE